MVKKEKQEKLPGMPGPPARALEQREVLNEAPEAVHDALVPFIEGVPVDNGTAAQFRISRKIGGDMVTVISSPESTSRVRAAVRTS